MDNLESQRMDPQPYFFERRIGYPVSGIAVSSYDYDPDAKETAIRRSAVKCATIY